MEYITTKEQCENNIVGVCRRCGGTLSAIETVDNSNRPTFWAGCLSCNHFDNGVTVKVYQMAVLLVEDHFWNPYGSMKPKLEDKEEYAEWRRNAIAGAVDKIYDVLSVQKQFE